MLAHVCEIFLAHSTDTSLLQSCKAVLKLLRADRVISYCVAHVLLWWRVNILLFVTLFYVLLV